MARKPGRLYRTLKPAQSLFRFTFGSTVLTDHDINSVTIHHGGNDGISPSTMEITAPGLHHVATTKNCQLALTDYALSLLVSRLAADLTFAKPRFTGRVGRMTVEDRENGDQTTTLMASSLIAQYPALKRSYNFSPGTTVWNLLRTIMNHPAVPMPTLEVPAPSSHFGLIASAESGKYSDLIGKYTNDLGLSVRLSRAGVPRLYSHEYRHQVATSNLSNILPISRSQVLSPSRWEQPNELRPRKYRVFWLDENSTEMTLTVGDPNDVHAEVDEIDMKHVRFSHDRQPRQEGAARRARGLLTGYEVPEVKIDLLALISSRHEYHRHQAARLLLLQPGDPVYFSGDWSFSLRGITYAEQISETITSDSWEITLSLQPSENVTGYVSPEIPARIWAQATDTWAEAVGTWNEA